MKCVICPVMEKCLDAKFDMVRTVEPDMQEEVAQKMKGICPLEMAVEMNISALEIALHKMIKDIEGKKHGYEKIL